MLHSFFEINCSQTKFVAILFVLSVGFFNAIFRLTDFLSVPLTFGPQKRDKQVLPSGYFSSLVCKYAIHRNFEDLYLRCEGRFLEVDTSHIPPPPTLNPPPPLISPLSRHPHPNPHPCTSFRP